MQFFICFSAAHLLHITYCFEGSQFEPNIQRNLYIYDDEGVDKKFLRHAIKCFDDFHVNVSKISAKFIKCDGLLGVNSVFLMPGGADLPYVAKLNGLGNHNIRKFVSKGGIFIGICAGGYYASSYVDFDASGPNEVLGKRELNYYNCNPQRLCTDVSSG